MIRLISDHLGAVDTITDEADQVIARPPLIYMAISSPMIDMKPAGQ